jgi:hypothetical protein
MIAATGPKVSVCMMDMSWVTPVRTVAGTKLPSMVSPPCKDLGAALRGRVGELGSSTWAFCSRMTMGPSTPSAVGSPEG